MKFVFLIIAVFLSGCIHLTPLQERLLSPETEPEYITAVELRNLLPDYAVVEDGTYQLTPLGAMPTDVWCNQYAASVLRPKDWNCQDYSRAAAEKMQGYAFGLAWNEKLDHMLNIFVDTDRKIMLYEPQACQWARMGVDHIVIKQ